MIRDGISCHVGAQEINNENKVPMTDPPDLSMAVIRNDSGLPLSYWMHDHYDGTHEGTQMDVPINAEKPLAFDESGMYLTSTSTSVGGTDMKTLSSSVPRLISLSVRSPDGNRVLAPIRDIHIEGKPYHKRNARISIYMRVFHIFLFIIIYFIRHDLLLL